MPDMVGSGLACAFNQSAHHGHDQAVERERLAVNWVESGDLAAERVAPVFDAFDQFGVLERSKQALARALVKPGAARELCQRQRIV
jgi:hypothetical protein